MSDARRRSFPAGRSARISLVAGTALLTANCAMSPAAPSPGGTTTISANVQFCTDEINRYRATIGRAPLTRSSSLEQFAGEAAQHDHTAGVPHQLFANTNGGGVSRAETELLLWKNIAVRDVIRQGLATMWAAGPSGEHYGILAGPYTEVGCGIFVNGTEVSVAQDFR